jgi:hypothetical protein
MLDKGFLPLAAIVPLSAIKDDERMCGHDRAFCVKLGQRASGIERMTERPPSTASV